MSIDLSNPGRREPVRKAGTVALLLAEELES
jgi:hypothetical protein